MERSWRAFGFRIPSGEAPAPWAGMQLVDGRLGTVTGDAAVRQSLLLLLSTRPGERLMRPDYGCELDTLVFAPNDDTTAGIAIHYVKRAVERWEPRVDLVKVDAARDHSRPGRLEITVDYRIRETSRLDRIVVPLALLGGAP